MLEIKLKLSWNILKNLIDWYAAVYTSTNLIRHKIKRKYSAKLVVNRKTVRTAKKKAIPIQWHIVFCVKEKKQIGARRRDQPWITVINEFVKPVYITILSWKSELLILNAESSISGGHFDRFRKVLAYLCIPEGRKIKIKHFNLTALWYKQIHKNFTSNIIKLPI